jgi:hypothetical protein
VSGVLAGAMRALKVQGAYDRVDERPSWVVLVGVGASHNRGSASARTPSLAPAQRRRRTSPRTKVNCSSTMNFIPLDCVEELKAVPYDISARPMNCRLDRELMQI